MSGTARAALDTVYRTEKRRVLATLIRLLGSFEAAEEALADAFAAAAAQWPATGVPANPCAWLVSAGRFRTIDRWRRQARIDGAMSDPAMLAVEAGQPTLHDPIADDDLRLIFICCHPALPPDMRVALTLREVGGLTTEEIARAYLMRTPAIAQRIVRAKATIREKVIPYEVPDADALPLRLGSVLQVVYLIFNEGYAATGGGALVRADLCAEAIRLGRLVVGLMDEPETKGLLALMLLHDSRRDTRLDANGDLVLLEDQDRARWDGARIQEAQRLIIDGLSARRAGPYLIQASIAAVHAEAASAAATDWREIVVLYGMLARLDPSPVVALNRAAAIGMRDGPEAGLAAINAVMNSGRLDAYHLAHAARADMLRRLGRAEAARTAYRRALDLARQPTERRFLEHRLAGLTQP